MIDFCDAVLANVIGVAAIDEARVQLGQHEGQAARQHRVGNADTRGILRRAGDPAAAHAGGDGFRQAADHEGDIGRKFGDQRDRLAGHRAVEIVLDDPHAVTAGDIGNRAAALFRQGGAGRVLAGRHQEDHLRMLLGADALEIIRDNAVLIRFHQRHPPTGKGGAAADVGIGDGFEDDTVARRGHRRHYTHHRRMGAKRRDDVFRFRRPAVLGKPASARHAPAVGEGAGVIGDVVGMLTGDGLDVPGDQPALADIRCSRRVQPQFGAAVDGVACAAEGRRCRFQGQ
ncbi:hypothetical protein D3C86_1421900 [compost metagenome]